MAYFYFKSITHHQNTITLLFHKSTVLLFNSFVNNIYSSIAKTQKLFYFVLKIASIRYMDSLYLIAHDYTKYIQQHESLRFPL